MRPSILAAKGRLMAARFGGTRWISIIALRVALHGYRLEESTTARIAERPESDGEQMLRCRAHRRWKEPPPLRTCLMCKLIARKHGGGTRR